MDFNTFLIRFGIDPNNFVNRYCEPIKTQEGFIYEVEQRKDIRICPDCDSIKAHIQDYTYVEINCSETDHIKDILRIKKVRFKCCNCNKTYTMPINGIDRYDRTSNQTIKMIVNDFFKVLSFSQIADRYGLTRQRILQIFDEKINFVPRRHLPFALCIDEIKFSKKIDQKYCCILYDHNKKMLVDIIRNRQLPYLNEYFSDIKEKERDNVKVFVSDMYDAYASVKRKYFPKALHIVDLFHVTKQLTEAVNKIRVKAMKKIKGKSPLYYRFMKRHWRLFLRRKEDIPNKFYTDSKTLNRYHYDDLIYECCLNDQELLKAHNILQDFYHYHLKRNFNDALVFINYIADRLVYSDNDILIDVGNTYRKWSVEIANGLSRSQRNKRYTNGIAESQNNNLKTIIKVAYGYHNFERFRKRALLINSYKKDLE